MMISSQCDTRDFLLTYPALKVHLSTERDQGLDASHLSDAVITLLNQLKER